MKLRRPCSAAGSEERAPRRLRKPCEGADYRTPATTEKTTRARSTTRRLQGGVALVPRSATALQGRLPLFYAPHNYYTLYGLTPEEIAIVEGTAK